MGQNIASLIKCFPTRTILPQDKAKCNGIFPHLFFKHTKFLHAEGGVLLAKIWVGMR